MREITVFTHRRPEDTTSALERLAEQAASAGVTLRLDEEETRKHDLKPGPGIELNAPIKDDVELCTVLGGDGTILRALQRYAGTGVPVFAINFGEIGFGDGRAAGHRGRHPARSERGLRAAAAAGDRAGRAGGSVTNLGTAGGDRRLASSRRADGHQRRRDPP